MRTFKEIIKNQKEFKEKIMKYLIGEFQEAKSDLRSIDTKDEYILSEKKKLEQIFKRANSKYKKSLSQLFFMHPTRNKEKYVWWEEIQEKAIILKYEKQ